MERLGGGARWEMSQLPTQREFRRYMEVAPKRKRESEQIDFNQPTISLVKRLFHFSGNVAVSSNLCSFKQISQFKENIKQESNIERQ